jgi:hypothetical protein
MLAALLPSGLLTTTLAALLTTGLLTTFLLATLLTTGLLATLLLATLLTAGLLTTFLLATLLTALLTATAFAMTLILLPGLIPLLALGLVIGLLRSFRLLGVVHHIDSPRMLKADVETASTVEPAATVRM